MHAYTRICYRVCRRALSKSGVRRNSAGAFSVACGIENICDCSCLLVCLLARLGGLRGLLGEAAGRLLGAKLFGEAARRLAAGRASGRLLADLLCFSGRLLGGSRLLGGCCKGGACEILLGDCGETLGNSLGGSRKDPAPFGDLECATFFDVDSFCFELSTDSVSILETCGRNRHQILRFCQH